MGVSRPPALPRIRVGAADATPEARRRADAERREAARGEAASGDHTEASLSRALQYVPPTPLADTRHSRTPTPGSLPALRNRRALGTCSSPPASSSSSSSSASSASSSSGPVPDLASRAPAACLPTAEVVVVGKSHRGSAVGPPHAGTTVNIRLYPSV